MKKSMKEKLNEMKAKVKAKGDKVKAKLGVAKVSVCAACAVLLCALMAGCNSLATPSRSQTNNFDGCYINIFAPYGSETNGLAAAGLNGDILSQNMAIENSGTETNAQTPTQPISPTTTITATVPVNKAGSNMGLGDAAISFLKSLFGGSSTTGTASASESTTSGGTCTDGSCTTGQ